MSVVPRSSALGPRPAHSGSRGGALARGLGLVLVSLLLAACPSSGVAVDWEASDSLAWVGAGTGDELTDLELEVARAEIESGSTERARLVALRLRKVAEDQPGNLAAVLMLQDARLAAGESRADLAAEARALASGDVYGEPFAPLLAARLEPDPVAARLLIEGPLAETGVSLAAPGMGRAFRASARFALAYLGLVAGDLAGARGQLEACLELDPGHFAARRLEVYLLRREGDLISAHSHLEHWVELTASSPVVDSQTWFDAAMDLAILSTELERFGAAADHLALITGPRPGRDNWGRASDRTRRRGLLLGAVLAAEAGRPEDALGLAREARRDLDRGSSLFGLALVQEAELLELFLGRPAEAAVIWDDVIERFGAAIGGGGSAGLAEGGDSEFDELLRVLTARVRLARLERAGFGLPGTPAP